MHHFFVPSQSIQKDRLTVRASQAHQIRDVLRLQSGEEIIVLDNTGSAYRVRLDKIGEVVTGLVLETVSLESEPRVRIVLYQALLKADKMEWVLQKGAEIGVAAFVPMATERTVARRISESKMERWQRILSESSEQAHRSRIPSLVKPISFAEAIQRSRGVLSLIPYESERGRKLADAVEPGMTDVNIIIGPEGGFGAEEIQQARDAGALPVTLGPRILRAETAGLLVSSAILFACGEL